MEQLERPAEIDWDERRLWFEEQEATRGEAGVGQLSEQACALMIDLQAAFCAGAWTAVIVLAAAIVDAQSFHSGFPNDGLAEERSWLRGLRNALLHENRKDPVITVEDQWTRRGDWERAARRAVETAFDVLYPAAAKARAEGGRAR
ncbi:MAG: hypothetical protein MI920_21675 [Kiloniellales bacterium]|nr:hypothetical protein [Kiloniellales bacterium]